VYFMESHKFLFSLHNTKQNELFLFYLFLINAFSFFHICKTFLLGFYDFFSFLFLKFDALLIHFVGKIEKQMVIEHDDR
jgi:hypothetical protein